MNRTYLVGRSSEADIQIQSKHDSVGKLHLEITVLADGRVCVTDRRSANGTAVRSRDGWKPIKGTETVSMDAEIRMGDYSVGIRDLLAQVNGGGGAGKTKMAGRSAEPQEIRNFENPGQSRGYR